MDSARTSTDAWAVDEQFAAAGQAPPPVSYHWNGTTWSLVTITGFNPATGAAVAEALHFNGTAWAVAPMQQPGTNTPGASCRAPRPAPIPPCPV